MTDLLARIQARADRTGRGVGLASSYVKTMASVFTGRDAEEFNRRLKAAEGRLVYRDETMDVTGGLTYPEDGGLIKDAKTFGLKAELTPTANAAMDFACILTTKRRDRDGDIMHPDGMTIDPAMPLLWQHLPLEPIGVLKRVLSQDDKAVTTHFAVADTKMGRDAAALIEFGALRVSHGFNPVAFKPIDSYTGSDMDEGWEITKSHVMEGSVVSIPANTDARITLFSRGTLKSHVIGSWAKQAYDARPPIVQGGWTPPPVNVTVNIDNQPKPATEPVALPPSPSAKATDAPMTPESLAGITPEEGKKDDSKVEDEKKVDDKVVDDKDVPSVPLSEIKAILDTAAKVGDLPREAQDRVNTLQGMVETATTDMDDFAADIAEATAKQDVTAVLTHVETLVSSAVGALTGMIDEAGKVLEVPGIPETIEGHMNQLIESAGLIRDAVSCVADAAVEAEQKDADDPMMTPPNPSQPTKQAA